MLRRFRFSLRALVFGVVVISAGMAWWISWPHRQASHLIDAMASSPEEAEAMAGKSGMWNVLRRHPHDRPYLEPQPRSIGDAVVGRQSFTVVVPTHEKQGDGTLEFTGTLIVTRGALRGPIELDARERSPGESTK